MEPCLQVVVAVLFKGSADEDGAIVLKGVAAHVQRVEGGVEHDEVRHRSRALHLAQLAPPHLQILHLQIAPQSSGDGRLVGR